jgi:hypothetical protein
MWLEVHDIIYGTPSGRVHRIDGEKFLGRLAIYLKELGFCHDDPLIGRIMKIDDRFHYPIESGSD